MPRSKTKTRAASQVKAADDGVRLPVEVYEDLMKKMKRMKVLEKCLDHLRETIRIQDQIIAELKDEYQVVNSLLNCLESCVQGVLNKEQAVVIPDTPPPHSERTATSS